MLDWKKTMMKMVVPAVAAGVISVIELLLTGNYNLEIIITGFVTGLSLSVQNYNKHKPK